MKVKEVIALLQNFDGERELMFRTRNEDEDDDWDYTIESIREEIISPADMPKIEAVLLSNEYPEEDTDDESDSPDTDANSGDETSAA